MTLNKPLKFTLFLKTIIIDGVLKNMNGEIMSHKIPFCYRGILFAAIMSCSTAMIVSAIIITLHGASHKMFINVWSKVFLTA